MLILGTWQEMNQDNVKKIEIKYEIITSKYSVERETEEGTIKE